jgi:malonyl-CoA/methylmalonyl-CoA synthetase
VASSPAIMLSTTDPIDWVDSVALERPDQPCINTAAGSALTYAALRTQSRRMAAALRARQVAVGDRVAVQIDKSIDAVVLYIACLRAGAVFVPINVANTPVEVEYFFRDSGPRLAVIRPADRQQLEPLARAAGVQHVDTLGSDGRGSFADLVADCADDKAAPRAVGGDSLAAIVYTSGTTGRSKGAMLTRGNLASNAAALAAAWRFTDSDILLHTLPLFHVHGLFAAINTVLASGSSMLLMPRFDAEQTLAILPRVSVYMGVPTHYTRLLQEPGLDRGAASGMRLFISGSAPLLPETHREFLRRTGHQILERYGMTETLMNTSNPYDGARIPGSVGKPLPGISVRVRDSALEIRGPNVFAGYWGDAEKTQAAFSADGWFKSGDLGRIDPDGYVYIMGRAKDLVISGGYNVYPKEVETELDALAGVLESAVFGLPHPDLGEGVTAAVVALPGAELSESGIFAAMKTRLASYKIPKRILFLDELPRNAMSKVQKNALRRTYASLYGAR